MGRVQHAIQPPRSQESAVVGARDAVGEPARLDRERFLPGTALQEAFDCLLRAGLQALLQFTPAGAEAGAAVQVSDLLKVPRMLRARAIDIPGPSWINRRDHRCFLSR